MSTTSKRKALNLWTNLAIFAAAIVVLILGFGTSGASGTLTFAGHTALALALLVGLTLHLALHWRWVAKTARKLLRGSGGANRLRFLVDVVLGLSFLALFISGIALWVTGERSATIGVEGSPWLLIHHTVTKLLLLSLAAHLILARRWIGRTLRRWLGRSSSR